MILLSSVQKPQLWHTLFRWCLELLLIADISTLLSTLMSVYIAKPWTLFKIWGAGGEAGFTHADAVMLSVLLIFKNMFCTIITKFKYIKDIEPVETGSCGDERVPDNVPTMGRLTPYFTWENNPREHQSFGLAIYGTTYLFLEILWGYFCKLNIYFVQKCLDGLWQVMYCFV